MATGGGAAGARGCDSAVVRDSGDRRERGAADRGGGGSRRGGVCHGRAIGIVGRSLSGAGGECGRLLQQCLGEREPASAAHTESGGVGGGANQRELFSVAI